MTLPTLADMAITAATLPAELACLGALMLCGGDLDEVYDLLPDARMFSDRRHQMVYAAIRAVASRGERADLVTVPAELGAGLDAAGGFEFLMSLNETVGTHVNARHHAQMVASAAKVRGAMSAALAIVGRASRSRLEDADELLEWASSQVYDAVEAMATDTRQPMVSLRESMRGVLDKARHAHENPGQVAAETLITGLDSWDGLLGPLSPGGLHVIGARPKMGKTALATQVALHAAAARGFGTLYFTTEVPHQDVSLRAFANLGGVDARNVRTGILAPTDISGMVQATALARPYSDRFFVWDRPDLGVDDIHQGVRRYRRVPGLPPLRLIIVDQFHQMRARVTKAREDEMLRTILHDIHTMTGKYQVVTLVLMQLSRKCEDRTDKRPIPSDVRGTGAVEEYAHTLTLMYRDEVYNPTTVDKGIAELNTCLNRNGPTGTVRTRYEAKINRFTDLGLKDDR